MKTPRISVDVQCPGCGEKLFAVGHQGARIRLAKHVETCERIRKLAAKKGPRS